MGPWCMLYTGEFNQMSSWQVPECSLYDCVPCVRVAGGHQSLIDGQSPLASRGTLAEHATRWTIAKRTYRKQSGGQYMGT